MEVKMRLQTYKFYDDKGRRLAIFYENGIITVIPCSKKDHFSIKKAKELYEGTCNSAIKYEVDGINKIDDLVDWCYQRYKKVYKYGFGVSGGLLRIMSTKSSKTNNINVELHLLH